jgi:ribosomal protein L37AE/L43A
MENFLMNIEANRPSEIEIIKDHLEPCSICKSKNLKVKKSIHLMITCLNCGFGFGGKDFTMVVEEWNNFYKDKDIK